VYRIVKQYRETGSVEVRTSLRGRKAKLSQEEINQVNAALQKQPDITLGELVEQLHLHISPSRLGRIVREKLGYSFKKKVIHASEQERPRCAGKARSMERTNGKDSGRKTCFPG